MNKILLYHYRLEQISLINLPTEIIHHILDYCDTKTILLNIRCVCKTLNDIVNNYDRIPLIIDINSMNNLEDISHTIQLEQVTSLTITNNIRPEEKLPFSLLDSLKFTRLRSLTIERARDEQLKYLLRSLNTNSLISLSIELNTHKFNQIWPTISDALIRWNLRAFSVNNTYLMKDRILWSSSMHGSDRKKYLVLQKLQNLQTLVMQKCIIDEKIIPKRSCKFESNLMFKCIILINCIFTCQHFERLFFPISSLRHLKLICESDELNFIFHGSYWERIISTNLPHIDRFEFFFSYHQNLFKRDKNIDFDQLQSLIDEFRTPFWLDEKHWFATYIYNFQANMICLYTTPIITKNDQTSLRCEVSWTDETFHLTKGSLNRLTDYDTNETLTTLNLSNSSIVAMGAQHIAAALKTDKTITSLNLNFNDLGKCGLEYIANAMRINETIITLNLRHNFIQDEGIQHLIRALKTNKKIKHLDLEWNKISHVGSQYLADMLTNNTTLITLNLRYNPIKDLGAQYLAYALRNNQMIFIFYTHFLFFIFVHRHSSH
ncbi:unnamed protein product [Adineta ricciae]|uniref:F-box domain-containing protein n=1 Tax=Adineta ricciae TaxID=249248 RepID=A0A815M668_ADIRI|nr:unnamed protein product [Adineta ricciae]